MAAAASALTRLRAYYGEGRNQRPTEKQQQRNGNSAAHNLTQYKGDLSSRGAISTGRLK
jgi:hypothetical protein